MRFAYRDLHPLSLEARTRLETTLMMEAGTPSVVTFRLGARTSVEAAPLVEARMLLEAALPVGARLKAMALLEARLEALEAMR